MGVVTIPANHNQIDIDPIADGSKFQKQFIEGHC